MEDHQVCTKDGVCKNLLIRLMSLTSLLFDLHIDCVWHFFNGFILLEFIKKKGLSALGLGYPERRDLANRSFLK